PASRHDGPAATRRAGVSSETVPQLPRPGRERRRARASSRQRRRATHARPAHPTGDPRRRQHASLREELEPGGNDSPGRVSRTAASAQSTAGARGRAGCGPRTDRPDATRDTMIGVFFVLALAYIRRWLYLRSKPGQAIGAWRAASFLLGLFLVWGALDSP